MEKVTFQADTLQTESQGRDMKMYKKQINERYEKNKSKQARW